MFIKNKFITKPFLSKVGSLPQYHSIKHKFFSVMFIILTGCTTTPTNDINESYTSNIIKREKDLAQLQSWEVKGKIAFINSVERKSASLYWKKSSSSQQLNLTTYLGINVLKLISNDDVHTVEVDGKTYESNNLNELIESLVEVRFPTEALSYWIKAIPYNENDSFTFNPQSKLPLTLASHYNGHEWIIKYSSYQTVQKDNVTLTLPNKIKITSKDLTINFAINHWTI